jgi:hypothetical protein
MISMGDPSFLYSSLFIPLTLSLSPEGRGDFYCSLFKGGEGNDYYNIFAASFAK